MPNSFGGVIETVRYSELKVELAPVIVVVDVDSGSPAV